MQRVGNGLCYKKTRKNDGSATGQATGRQQDIGPQKNKEETTGQQRFRNGSVYTHKKIKKKKQRVGNGSTTGRQRAMLQKNNEERRVSNGSATGRDTHTNIIKKSNGSAIGQQRVIRSQGRDNGSATGRDTHKKTKNVCMYIYTQHI